MTTAAPDGGWGWVVCFGCFLTHMLADGIFFSFGIIYIDLLDYFGETKSDTAWIVSLPPGVCFIIGPVVAILIDKYGCRAVVISGGLITCSSFVLSSFVSNIAAMYVTLGLLGGVGYGLVYLPSIICVCQYFDKRRALATCIGLSGAGIGVFIFGPLTNMLIDLYTWKGTLLIEAALMLHCVPVGMLYRPLHQSNNVRREKKIMTPNYGATKYDGNIADTFVLSRELNLSKHYASGEIFLLDENSNKDVDALAVLDSLKSFLRNVFTNYLALFQITPFTIFVLSVFLYDLFYLVPTFYLPARAVMAGIPEEKATMLESALGISSTVGRVGFGWLFDKPYVNRMCLYATVLAFCGVCTAVGPQFSCFEVLLAFAVVYGLSSGLTIGLCPVLVGDIVGIEKLAAGFGVRGMFGGAAEILGPPLTGWLADSTGSYSIPFLAAGVSISTAGIIMFSILCIKENG